LVVRAELSRIHYDPEQVIENFLSCSALRVTLLHIFSKPPLFFFGWSATIGTDEQVIDNLRVAFLLFDQPCDNVIVILKSLQHCITKHQVQGLAKVRLLAAFLQTQTLGKSEKLQEVAWVIWKDNLLGPSPLRIIGKILLHASDLWQAVQQRFCREYVQVVVGEKARPVQLIV